MKSIIPKSDLVGFNKKVNAAFLERILEANNVEYFKGGGNYIVHDKDIEKLGSASAYFEERGSCAAIGDDPLPKYSDRFHKLVEFREDKIFDVNLNGNDQDFMDYLTKHYHLEK